ncbi:MAG TPA: DoxX family protein [Chitinophagaceae bacterium]|nr:DoxX family protein [Chitinophagaceae bacterium]
MTLIERMEHWGDAHHSKWLDVLRIALGIFLCYKGFEFLQDMSNMMNLLSSSFSFSAFTLLLLGHYIVFAHILGGILLVLGMLTRFACLIQIPVLIGAIFFVNAPEGLWQPFSEFWLSLLVLVLLIFFLVVGNGPWTFYKLAGQDRE